MNIVSSLALFLGLLQLLHMSSSPASQLHHTLVHAVEHDWFPAMCDGFVLVSGDTIDKASRSLSSSQLCQER